MKAKALGSIIKCYHTAQLERYAVISLFCHFPKSMSKKESKLSRRQKGLKLINVTNELIQSQQ